MKEFHRIKMSEDKNEKLTVAQMAELLGVNITTLRYYNKKGITPFKRDENNYRYYSKNQVKNFMIIKNFRTVGLSIEEIKELKKKFDLNNYKDITKILEKKVREFDRKIETMKEKSEALKNCTRYIKVLVEIAEVDPDYIFFENIILKQKEEMIFRIKNIEERDYAILYSVDKFKDLDAINTFYKRIEEEGYKIDGDLSIEIAKPQGELDKSFYKIKIFKVPVKK
ncbi:MerR family transcriptional regulator [Fusobacterium sp.]|uniref:helix-turn-helix domain-containing protein n=2 Tax=Fusobacterium sp. TaxID=68766 RepID=UPI0026083E89|nr:MerR family transcriptional regulator [Fusobacterium sp.]